MQFVSPESLGNSALEPRVRDNGADFKPNRFCLLGGVVGEYDNIKATTNLAMPYSSWTSLATVTNSYGVVPILDAGALTNNIRYYRAQKTGP